MNMADFNRNITAAVEYITPDMADALLASSRGNGPLRKLAISRYVHELEAGTYRLNGESIIVGRDTTGQSVLLDGHHRLEAVKRAGIGMWTVIVRNVDVDAWGTIDTGRARTASDSIYAILDIPNATGIAAAARVEILRRLGIHYHGQSKSRDLSGAEILHFVADHPRFVDGAQRVMTRHRPPNGLGATGATWGWLSGYVMENGNEDDWELFEAFMTATFTGEGLVKGNPALTLRNRLLSNFSKISRTAERAFVVKAWNAYYKSAPLSLIKWLAEEAFPNPLPEPQNPLAETA